MGKVELYEDIYKKNFSFGKNWSEFLKKLDKEKIEDAKNSLKNFSGLETFKGKVFVDIGCGSGLFSLCALLLGAKKVVSVDIDDSSINCAKFLRNKYSYSQEKWEIIKGSALDKEFINSLPKADILYSWGVLHHTGNMYEAFENVEKLSKKKTLFYLAIYNEFNGVPTSKTWRKIKKFYSSSGKISRKLMEIIYISYYVLGLLVYGRNPIKYIKKYNKNSVRGMDFFTDAKDWLGGYPYEYATTGKIKDYFEQKGFKLLKIRKSRREGCNEFLFRKEK